MSIPEPVQVFLVSFYSALASRDVDQLRRLYEVDFNNITSEVLHVSDARWPPPPAVAAFYEQRGTMAPLVVALYKELYYRYKTAYFSTELEWGERIDSNNNYGMLLEYFFKVEFTDKAGPASGKMKLPLAWQWDMLDEFVYHYLDTQRFRFGTAESIKDKPAIVETMRASHEAWTAPNVLLYLSDLIDASEVKQFIRDSRSRSVSWEALPLKTTLGYFAMISLMRLHVAFGDYRSALAVGSFVEISASALYWKAPAAHVTLIYNLSFAYMMVRRYHDAARIVSMLLSFLAHSRAYLQQLQGYQQKPTERMVERLHYILLLCETLSPGCRAADEAVQARLRDIRDRHSRAYAAEAGGETGDEAVLRELFMKGAPKLCDPVVLKYDKPNFADFVDREEATQRQLAIFMKEARRNAQTFNVQSIARLYNNLSLQKLTHLMGLHSGEGAPAGPDAAAAVDLVRSELLAVRNRAIQNLWRGGDLLSGEKVQLLGNLDIYLDGDTIYVKNLTTQRSAADFFIKQIRKAADVGYVPVAGVHGPGGHGPGAGDAKFARGK